MKRILFILLLFPWVVISSDLSNEKSHYFQQEVNYRISVKLDDSRHMLEGKLDLNYINKSNDTLYEIRFHLWPNAYRNRNTALCRQMLESGDTKLYFASEEERGYIDSLDFRSNSNKLTWNYNEKHIDICSVKLNLPLYPGDSVQISTPFIVKLPSGQISRMGHIGQAYAITQWYPKPAVYDQFGWHDMPYLDQGEFYSEYGSFDVSITLPENYVVGATGDLQTASEIAWMDEKASTAKDYSGGMVFPESSNRMKTIRFVQNNVHDFAWFADKRYHVLKGSVELPFSKRKVTTWSLYTNKEGRLWDKSIEYINDAVYHYSNWVGEYPYNQCTAVDGTISAGGGMEYPNVTIIGSSGNDFSLEMVIAHEVGHNWFYGLLGSNEREHPWMDEGINSFYEMRYVLKKYPPEIVGNKNELNSGLGNAGKLLGLDAMDYRASSKFTYLLSGTSYTEQAIGLPAADFSSMNYGTIVYKKTAVAMDYLANYLGDAVFDSCMKEYFNEWHFRHPYPQDIQRTFERISGKQLGWFFEGLIHSATGSDASLCCVKHTDEGLSFQVKDNSPTPIPVHVTGYNKDNQPVYSEWVETWKPNHQSKCPSCESLEIDAEGRSLDLYPGNNRSKRIFPEFSFLPKLHAPRGGTIYLTPVSGWNNYNGWLAGLSISNQSIPFRKIEYNFTPLYGFTDKSINGTACIEGIYPIKSKIIDRIYWTNQFRKFSYRETVIRKGEYQFESSTLGYFRYSPQARLALRKQIPESSRYNEIRIQSIHLWKDEVRYQKQNDFSVGNIRTGYEDFYRLSFHSEDKRVLDPWSAYVMTEANNRLLKLDGALTYRISFKEQKKGFDLRLYGGYAFIDKSDGIYGFSLSDRSGASGSNDYAFDEWYFGRTETSGFLSQQMALRQGQFKAYTPFGAYKQWILSLNMISHIPGAPRFLRIYADVGTTENLKKDLKVAYGIDASMSYNAGICLSLARNAIEIYLPVLLSDEIKKYNDFQSNGFFERIRFVFDLNRLRPSNIRYAFL